MPAKRRASRTAGRLRATRAVAPMTAAPRSAPAHGAGNSNREKYAGMRGQEPKVPSAPKGESHPSSLRRRPPRVAGRHRGQAAKDDRGDLRGRASAFFETGRRIDGDDETPG
jgi:hypothetical protein